MSILDRAKELADTLLTDVPLPDGWMDTEKLHYAEWADLYVKVSQSGQVDMKAGRAVFVEHFGADTVAAWEKAVAERLSGRSEWQRKELPGVHNYQLPALITDLEPLIPGADEAAKVRWAINLLADVVITAAADLHPERRAAQVQRHKRLVQYARQRVLAAADNPPQPPAEKEEPWRTDLATIQPQADGSIQFFTRNIKAADRMNADGGAEWIIARINGSGFQRLLIMVMGPSSRSTRIYFEYEPKKATEQDKAFSVPMAEEAHWMVDVNGGSIRVYLNGSEIWASRTGAYAIRDAIMNGYARRGFDGEWKEIGW